MKNQSLIFSALGVLLLAGCATSGTDIAKGENGGACVLGGAFSGAKPNWVGKTAFQLNLPKNYYYGDGSSDLRVSYEERRRQARAQARSSLVESVSVLVSSRLTNRQDRNRASTQSLLTAVARMRTSGIEVVGEWENEQNCRHYVLLRAPKRTADQWVSLSKRQSRVASTSFEEIPDELRGATGKRIIFKSRDIVPDYGGAALNRRALNFWILRRENSQFPQARTEAIAVLGSLAYWGKYGARDYKRAAELFQEAAESRNDARLSLGYMYEKGLGVSQNSSRAAELYRETNLPAAQFRLGLLYAKGEGVRQDFRQARTRFSLSARENYPPAIKMLKQFEVR